MIKAAIDKLNGARTLDDILAPIEHKVQELVHFADSARGKAIDLRQQAEDMQREAAALEADASTALNIAARMEELIDA